MLTLWKGDEHRMSGLRDFNERYRVGDTPWELGRPDNTLMDFVNNWPIDPGRALDIGCGTGQNALWLSGAGFDTVGIDVSKEAVRQARENARKTGQDVRFDQLDFLETDVGGGPFHFAFDRGCFHTMDSDENREKFAARLALLLEVDGLWLSVLGNDDAPPREGGPPRRTALQIVRAVEPYFEIQSLQASFFDSNHVPPPRSWQCLMKKRSGSCVST